MQNKCYVVVKTCTTTRTVSLQLLPDSTAEEFQQNLKLFIAKRGTPKMLVSDDNKTFVVIIIKHLWCGKTFVVW